MFDMEFVEATIEFIMIVSVVSILMTRKVVMTRLKRGTFSLLH
jgi:hypothetical protein